MWADRVALVTQRCSILTIALVAMVTAPSARSFQASRLDGSVAVTKVMVRTLRVQKGADSSPVETARTTFFLAANGTYRKETLDRQTDDLVVEIIRPHENQRIKLDLRTRLAAVGPGGRETSGHPLAAKFPEGTDISSETASLGTRTVGNLLLEGERRTFHVDLPDGRSMVHTFQVWSYQFPDPLLAPIVLEQRFDEADAIEEQRIMSIAMVEVLSDIFDVPAGFKVVEGQK